MKFDIEVLSVTRETKPNSKGGTYVQLDVAFKNLTAGKTEGKKLMSFAKPDVAFKTLNEATNGARFTVTSEKPDGEQFWQWTSVVPIAPGTSSTTSDVAKKGVAAPKSTYETPEERAKKQVYIVKQSSIGSAIELLSLGAKSPPSVQSVIDVAQKFTDWVLSAPSAPNSEVLDLIDMPNDDFNGDNL